MLPFTAKETVINLSSQKFRDEEMDVLKCGLSHSISPSKLNKRNVYMGFEQIHYNMAKYIKDKNLEGQLRSELSHLCHTNVSSFRPSIKDLKQLRILKNLINNKHIVILKPDKGNGIVIMNREDYDKEIFKIIQDPKKLKPVHLTTRSETTTHT